VPRPAGCAVLPETTAAARPGTQPTAGERGRAGRQDAQPAPPAAHPTAHHQRAPARRAAARAEHRLQDQSEWQALRRSHQAGQERAGPGIGQLPDASAELNIDFVKPPRRLSIPGCIGCGAMRQYESCEGACSERRLELVSGGDYDELTAAAAACRGRIEGLRAVVGELARAEAGPGEWRVAYEGLQQSARSVLRRSGPAAGGRDDELVSPAETVIVWRCQDCGGVDAPQPCIDVCIWGPADWVDVASYESQRSRAAVDREVEQSLAGLLRRFAFATPRAGQWERSWRAFQSQARIALQSRGSRHAASEMAIRQAQADG